MSYEKNYKLLVYVSNGHLIRYFNQDIDGFDLPDHFDIGIHVVDGGHKYVVALDDKCCSVIAILKTIDNCEWVKNEIEVINKHNKKIPVRILSKRSSIIPPPPDMIIDLTQWELIIATIDLGLYPIFTGSTGSGKTALAEAIAKVKGYNFYPINCGAILKPKSTLVGTVQAHNGSTKLIPSEFMHNFKSDEPTIIFLDEISRATGPAVNALMTATDRKQNYIYVEELAERIFKGPKVIFIAAANFGIQYVDTRKMDNAFMNRFIPYHLNYLKEDDEVRLLQMNVPDASVTDIRKLVKTANILRDAYDSLGQEVSHRHTIDFAKFFSMGFSYQEIVNNLLINLFVNGNDDRRDQVEQILNGRMP